MKRSRNRILDYAVYVLVRVIVCLCQSMTIRQSYAVADLLAKLIYRVDKRHRVVAMENLRGVRRSV